MLKTPWNKGIKTDPEKLFWSHIEKTNHCWNWTASINPKGYGQFGINGKNVKAHRFSYELIFGPIPKDKQLDHLCRNRACVNPDHLEIVSNKENVLRGTGICAQNSRKTHCPQGHEYNSENTIISKDQTRICRICKNARNAKFMRNNRISKQRGLNAIC